MTKSCDSGARKPWSVEEDAVLVGLMRQYPTEQMKQIAERAVHALPHRTLVGVTGRMKCSPLVLQEKQAKAVSAAPSRAIAPACQSQSNAMAVTVKQGCCVSYSSSEVSVSLSRPPFGLELAERDETKPYDRRAAFGSKPHRPETPFDLFKRLLREEMRL